MGIAAIDRLGAAIERAWRETDFEPHAFPDICLTALSAARLHETVQPADIVSWALATVDLPPQADPGSRFGQPPVTLFRSRLFYIDALFWVDGMPAIHDHGFSGAFQVLAGSSIETRFEFQRDRDINGRFALGSLRVVDSVLLDTGSIRPIVAGPGMIHSLFHLARPSVSLVARTYWDPQPGLQFEYFQPGIASESFARDEHRERLTQIAKMLQATSDPSFEQQLGDLVARSDLQTAFALLRSCAALPDRGLLNRLVDRVRDPQAVALFRQGFAEIHRVDYLRSRRSLVHDPDLRFFLAVLLNSHRRVDVLRLAASYYPSVAPEKQIAAWLAQLSRVTMRVQVDGAAWEPNALGLPEITPPLEQALVHELSRPSTESSREGDAFLARLRALPHLAPLFRT
jgi:hypothetical protein